MPTPRSCGERVALIERLAAAKSWLRAALTNAFAFGGSNAVLALRARAAD